MSSDEIERLIRKYFGISIPRITLAILMIVFSIIIIIFPQLLAWIIAIYLLVNGILIIVEEYTKNSKSLSKS